MARYHQCYNQDVELVQHLGKRVPPQKVQIHPPIPPPTNFWYCLATRVLQWCHQLLPNSQLMGAIVPLIGVVPKTRLLIFCPWRKSTFIPPVPSPAIELLNITLDLCPVVPPNQVLESLDPTTMEFKLVCFVEDVAYLIVFLFIILDR